ncbi:hypothetical protein GAYE_PCTG75G1624 [Galdieria yellowstonensis]|uniref:RING-type domain-containing protein n=1 Tax=Galdieria yellowstonensis TaxID=3028027 RepID=A0AAV9I8Q4_9RHOD|nr:hypothetical protein GAYE_PCTG75G1624 [Galdieria yellowstonensis]
MRGDSEHNGTLNDGYCSYYHTKYLSLYYGSFPAPSGLRDNSLGVPSTSASGFLSLHSSKFDEIAPELVYGDKDSFHKVRPRLQELFKYRKGLAPLQNVNNCNDCKLQLEEEETIVAESQSATQLRLENKGRNILESVLYAVYLKGRDEDAAWLFEQVLRDHNICVICLEDFEDGCSIRILRCAHFFHSSCLRQWLTKSMQCPLCKEWVYVIAANTSATAYHQVDRHNDIRDLRLESQDYVTSYRENRRSVLGMFPHVMQ